MRKHHADQPLLTAFIASKMLERIERIVTLKQSHGCDSTCKMIKIVWVCKKQIEDQICLLRLSIVYGFLERSFELSPCWLRGNILPALLQASGKVAQAGSNSAQSYTLRSHKNRHRMALLQRAGIAKDRTLQRNALKVGTQRGCFAGDVLWTSTKNSRPRCNEIIRINVLRRDVYVYGRNVWV